MRTMPSIQAPLRTERGVDRRYHPHLLRYIALALAAGLTGLFAEYRINGTLLLRPAYRWTTGEIQGLVVSPLDGAYSLSFKTSQLDWRVVRSGPGGEWPDFELLGHPDLRLTIYRRTDPGPEFRMERGLLEEIPQSNAYQGRLLLTPEHEVIGAFPIQDGFALLRFRRLPGPGGDEYMAAMNDIQRIASSFRGR